jgi:Fe-S cluster assembly protein SufD
MGAIVKEKPRYKPETAQIFDSVMSLAANDRTGLPASLAAHQDAASSLFQQYGVPFARLERWKYSNFYPVLKKMDLAPSILADLWQGDLSYIKPIKDMLDQDWVVEALAANAPKSEGAHDDYAFWHLNAVQSHQGWVLDIPDNVEVKAPLILNSLNKDGTYNAMRLLIRLGKNARVTLHEKHAGDTQTASYFKNWVTQVIVGEGAALTHLRDQNDTQHAAYVQNTHVDLARDAQYTSLTINTGALMFRNQVHVDLNGAGAHASVRSSANVSGDQHIDLTTTMAHNVPSSTSNQTVRNVLGGKSTGVFQGKVCVAKGADFTDGSQSSKAILMSPFATMHAKPELEIYADEVKCAHGATCGALDESALFYARSRGIAYDDARAMLVEAFLEEVKDGLCTEDE